MSLIPPNKNPELIINDFILYATGHLATVGGIINTISLYPGPAAPVPGPGIITWTGYQITPATPPTPQLDVEPFTDEQLVISELGSIDGLSIDEATALAIDTDLELNPPSLTLDEVDLLFEQSLDPNPIPDSNLSEGESQSVNLGDDESTNQTENSNNDNVGERVPNYKTNVKVPDDIVLAMRKWKVGLDNPLERAHFLAQCSHESSNFREKVEGLNYSSAGLQKTFSKYFPTKELADSYARKPEKIASKVYANRMGNGDEASKEGYKYRGRGYIQLTGKSNYKKMYETIGGNDNIVSNPNLVETKFPADSACYFWTKNNLKKYAVDATDDSIKKLTKRINGGQNGLADRKEKFKLYWGELEKDNTLWS